VNLLIGVMVRDQGLRQGYQLPDHKTTEVLDRTIRLPSFGMLETEA
jgi:hypothetical protein